MFHQSIGSLEALCLLTCHRVDPSGLQITSKSFFFDSTFPKRGMSEPIGQVPQLWTHQREVVRGNLARLSPEKWHQLKSETAGQLKGTPGMVQNGTG